MTKTVRIKYFGKVYTRYLGCKDLGKVEYYISTCKGELLYLHREIYRREAGEIPEGYVVHHVDFDPENNHVSNLQCLSKSEHMKAHWRSEERKTKLANRNKERFSDPANRESQSKHMKRYFSDPSNRKAQSSRLKQRYKDAPSENRVCVECGETYEAKKYGKPNFFCSQRCRSRSSDRRRRQRRIGLSA